MSKSTDKNKDVIRRLYSEVMGRGKIEMADELFHPGFIDHMPILEKPNKEGLLLSVDVTREAFPDVKPEIIAEIAEDDWVSVAVEAKATHKGNYLGIPPTNRPVTWQEIHVWRIKDGKIVEHHGIVSIFQLLKMIGKIDLPGVYKFYK